MSSFWQCASFASAIKQKKNVKTVA